MKIKPIYVLTCRQSNLNPCIFWKNPMAWKGGRYSPWCGIYAPISFTLFKPTKLS